MSPRALALVPDLMDRSKVEAAARAAGVELELVGTAADLAGRAEGADLVIVDLGRPGVLDALGQLAGLRTVGFGSHVDRELLGAAAAAGCATVMARSAFFGRVGGLLGGLAGAGPQPGAGDQPSADISSSAVIGSENIGKS